MSVDSSRIKKTIVPSRALSTEEAKNVFSDVENLVQRFRALISDAGGRVPTDSCLDKSLRNLVISAPRFRGEQPTNAVSPDFAEALRTFYLVKAVDHAARREIADLSSKLRLLHGEDIIISGQSGSQSIARDTAWEIVAAALCSDFCNEVEMVDPPDVLCTFQGERWGIACKMLRTTEPRRQVDRIIEGAEQLERHPAVERGTILVNVTDTLFHTGWDQAPLDTALQMFEQAVENASLYLDRRDLFRRLETRRKAQGFMLFGQTLFDDGEHLQLMTAASWPVDFRQPDDREREFLVALNRASYALTMPERPPF